MTIPDPHDPDAKPRLWHYFVVFNCDGRELNMEMVTAEEITTIDQVNQLQFELGRRYHRFATITSYQLLSGPTPENITVTWDTDDIFTVTHAGTIIVTVTHDDEGTAGMRAVLDTVNKLAASLGITVDVIGTPGV